MSLQKTSYKVADFIAWQKAGTLQLSPKFQRRSVWKTGAKSYLIDTILRDMPVPIIFLRDLGTDPKTLEPKREVVDGQQRLRTVLGFIQPALLSGLKDFNEERESFTVSRAHDPDAAGKKFQDLDPAKQRAILDYEFSVQVLPASMDDRTVVQAFRRLNSTNYTLNKQELRNATFYGDFKSSALEASAEQLHRWRTWGTFSDDDISRMHEVELTSECMASLVSGSVVGKSQAALDKMYKDNDAEFKGRKEVEKRFRAAMDAIADNFAPKNENSPLLRKRLIYTLILVVADAQFDLTYPVTKKAAAKKIAPASWDKLSEASEALIKRSAPDAVLLAADRRTTHPKERKALFAYLEKCF